MQTRKRGLMLTWFSSHVPRVGVAVLVAAPAMFVLAVLHRKRLWTAPARDTLRRSTFTSTATTQSRTSGQIEVPCLHVMDRARR